MSIESLEEPLCLPAGERILEVFCALSHLREMRGWKSPIVPSASRRVVALLDNAVVSVRDCVLER